MAKMKPDTALPEAAAPASAPAKDATEERPHRGGSYTRNADGTLTQTEGHDVAETKQE